MVPPALNMDVLSVIFDLVDLSTLCASSRVARTWRLTARNHTNYWQTLELDALSMSAADVMLFLDRLTARSESTATISLLLRCPAPTSPLNRLVMTSLVLPVLRHHVHRAEVLAFVVCPAFAEALWPLFSLDAPHLRALQVVVDGCAGDLAPIPSLFNAQSHGTLRHVLLRDVPLPDAAQPLRSVLHSVKATYTHGGSQDSTLERVLSWFPLSEALDLRSIDRRFGQRIPRLPDLGVLQLNTLKHLVIYHERYLLGIPHHLVPSLSFRVPIKAPSRIRQLVPGRGALALCFRVRMGLDMRYARMGRVVFVAEDGSMIREFSRINVDHMGSAAFLEEVILCDRLVSLTMPLAIGFRTLCERAYFLPQLLKLRLVMNSFPEWIVHRKAGAILCPKLATLVFRREIEEADATISLSALEKFMGASLAVDEPAKMEIILEDISLCGDESVGVITRRSAGVPWDAAYRYSDEGHWTCRTKRHLGSGGEHSEWLTP